MEFLEQLAVGMPSGQRIILCGFVGDPNTVGPRAWRPRPWRTEDRLSFQKRANVYATLSSFTQWNDGTFRRRTDAWAAGHAFMVDDVFTKVDYDLVKHTKPTVRVETSPGNEQWWYFLKEPITDKAKFDQLIRAFIEQNLLGADPGMAGINRVGRLPGFTNGKEKYSGAITKEVGDTDYDRRFTADGLIEAFGLSLKGLRRYSKRLTNKGIIQARVDHFERMLTTAAEYDMLKDADEPDPSGWLEVRCPWMHLHTDRADTGAAIRFPEEENDFHGAFRCHHGHCENKGWAEWSDVLVDIIAESMGVGDYDE